jgi:hypothetical protein
MSMLDALSGGGSWSTAIGWYGVQLSSSFGWGRGAGAAKARCGAVSSPVGGGTTL